MYKLEELRKKSVCVCVDVYACVCVCVCGGGGFSFSLSISLAQILFNQQLMQIQRNDETPDINLYLIHV